MWNHKPQWIDKHSFLVLFTAVFIFVHLFFLLHHDHHFLSCQDALWPKILTTSDREFFHLCFMSLWMQQEMMMMLMISSLAFPVISQLLSPLGSASLCSFSFLMEALSILFFFFFNFCLNSWYWCSEWYYDYHLVGYIRCKLESHYILTANLPNLQIDYKWANNVSGWIKLICIVTAGLNVKAHYCAHIKILID